MFVDGAFRRHLNTNIALKTLENRLGSACTPDECWNVIQDSAKNFGFHTVDMSLAGRRYQHCNGGVPEPSWQVMIPLSARDFIELTRAFEAASEHSVVAHYADSVRKLIQPKLDGWPDDDCVDSICAHYSANGPKIHQATRYGRSILNIAHMVRGPSSVLRDALTRLFTGRKFNCEK
jgi:hypothetical protein